MDRPYEQDLGTYEVIETGDIFNYISVFNLDGELTHIEVYKNGNLIHNMPVVMGKVELPKEEVRTQKIYDATNNYVLEVPDYIQ